MNEKSLISSGKRKAAVARAVFSSGKGEIKVNDRPLAAYHLFDRLKLEEPLRIAKEVLGDLTFSCAITVRGGGEKGQVDAARLALAKGIVEWTKSQPLKDSYLKYDRTLLVADVRRKESRKPGDSKARAMRQSSKR